MESMVLSVDVPGICNHTAPDIKITSRVTPSGAFLLTIDSITCKNCGAVANVIDSRGKHAPATALGYYFGDPPKTPEAVASPPPKKDPPAPLEEGPGTELSQELERLGISSCQACKGLARLMNQWGSDECRRRLDEIVADVLPRARAWYDHATLKEKLSVWWKSDQRLEMAAQAGTKAATWQLDDALRAVIRIQVLAALARWEAKMSH